MNAASETRSQALIVYLGKGTSPYPKPDPQRVVDRFGEPDALELLAYCESVMEELDELEPDWSVEDLEGATERVVTAVGARHPELSPDALDAVRWSFIWDWK